MNILKIYYRFLSNKRAFFFSLALFFKKTKLMYINVVKNKFVIYSNYIFVNITDDADLGAVT